MHTRMGAGVDFRFSKPGYTIIINLDHHYTASNVTQMVGRSTRQQGIQAGHCFCNNTVIPDAEPGLPYLKGREKTTADDNGPLYAGVLANNWDTSPINRRAQIASHFGANRWQKTKAVFDRTTLSHDTRAWFDGKIKTHKY